MEIKYPKRNSGHSDSFEIGSEFADFVCMTLAKENIILQNINSQKFQYETGENLQGFEIKFDGPHTRTKRCSIEIAEKSNGFNTNFINSGIYRGDNSWIYIHGNYELFFISSIKILRLLHESGKYEEAYYPKDLPTIKKFYLPHEKCFQVCLKYYEFRTHEER